MDLSLKQRLLGAAVLIALAVIFVPMFISGSAPQKSAEIETTSLAIPPAPDREFQQRVLPLDSAAASPTEPPVATGETLATVDTGAAPPPTAAPASGVDSPPTTPVNPAIAEPATPAPAEQQPATAAAIKPLPGQAADGRFFVHLGVYANGRNAHDLVAMLKKGGYPAFAEASLYQGKPAERVRVGPFTDRAAAEAARLRIKQLKPALPGSVVQLASDAAADAPASAVPATRAGSWAVQLGAFKAEDEAGKIRERLRKAGFTAFVDKVDSNGATLWRVRAGPEVDRGAADRLRSGIKDKLKLDGIIVTVP
jgi:DedD protein